MNKEDLLYWIGLTMVPAVGDVTANKLVGYCGSAEAVFKEKPELLYRIPQVGNVIVNSIRTSNVLKQAEKEINFAESNHLEIIVQDDPRFPVRLTHCEDAPIVLYMRGSCDLNNEKCIGIVGTRDPTPDGIRFTEELIQGLKPYFPLIISGLAYGIDAAAHRSSLLHGLPTAGVVAHSLDRVYPPIHKEMVAEMIANEGCMLTEFRSGTDPDRENFPKRNRVVAGMCDALIVVESAIKGGSLITADIAHSYDRDLFAVPGKPHDEKSAGCNMLIKTQKAALLESVSDLVKALNWDIRKPQTQTAPDLFEELNLEEMVIFQLLKREKKMNIDLIASQVGFPMSKTSGVLLELEFKGLIRSLPGKVFSIN